jgi:hypothetical protein
MSFSFGFEEDDDIEATDADVSNVPATVAAVHSARGRTHSMPAAETARNHKVEDLVCMSRYPVVDYIRLTVCVG